MIPDAVRPGSAMSLSIEMTNDGYGSIFNARTIEILLRNQSNGARYILDVIGDDAVRGNRLFLPKSHETKTLSITGGLPADMPVGGYEVILNLPDPYPSIHDQPNFSIHLANTGVWETATGYNRLNHAVQVSASATGTVYTGSNWFGLNGVTTPSAPTIATQPVNTTVTAGQTASFTVAAAGTGPLSYQWKQGTTNVGTNSETLTITNAQAGNSGSYTVVVSNSAGNDTSDAATLTVTADTTPPVKPGAPTTSSGSSSTPTLSGTTEAGATVRIYDNGILIGTVVANGNGQWTWTAAPPLGTGVHQITVTSTNASGNTSVPSAATTVTVSGSTTPPPVSSAGSGGGSKCGLGSAIAALGLAMMLLMALRAKDKA